MQQFLGKGSGWIIDSVLDHTVNISEQNLLVGSSYTELPKELDNPKKGLINIQNINDNECFKWCLFRYLHDADHNPARIRKVDKDFARELDFHNIRFPVKIRDIHKIKKKKIHWHQCFWL